MYKKTLWRVCSTPSIKNTKLVVKELFDTLLSIKLITSSLFFCFVLSSGSICTITFPHKAHHMIDSLPRVNLELNHKNQDYIAVGPECSLIELFISAFTSLHCLERFYMLTTLLLFQLIESLLQSRVKGQPIHMWQHVSAGVIMRLQIPFMLSLQFSHSITNSIKLSPTAS